MGVEFAAQACFERLGDRGGGCTFLFVGGD